MLASNPTDNPAILARMSGVAKRFSRGTGETWALSEIDFEIKAGTLIGLFGNNGAGKTTLTRLITGTLTADRGQVVVGGHDLSGTTSRATAQSVTGLCAADERSFYPRLSARDNLRLFGELRGLPLTRIKERVGRLCESLHITDAMLARSFQSLSSGERQRLNIARGMLHEPAILVVDEALRSADPSTVDRVSELLLDYVQGGERSILYTGHEFQGVEDLCHEIAVLDRGRMLLHGKREDVLRLARPTWRLEFDSAARARSVIQSAEGATIELGGARPEEDRERVAELVRDSESGLMTASFREHCSVRELLKYVAAGDDRGIESRTGQAASAPISAAPSATKSNWRLLCALWRRDRLTYLSYRFQVILQGAIMLLWAGLIYSFTSLLEPNSEITRELFYGDGFSYVILGVAYLHLGQTCLSQMGSQLREEQLQGTLEVVLTSGRSPLVLLVGSLSWPLAVRSAMTAFMLGASAWWFGARFGGADWGAFALTTLLMCLAFTTLGVLSAAFVLAFKRGDPIGRLLGVATLLVGGTYFPVESLPGWLRPFGEMHPMTHGLRAARMACLEGRGLSDASYLSSMGVLFAITVVFGALAIWGYCQALNYARHTGGLGHA